VSEHDHSFPEKRRLKHRKLFETLFSKGKRSLKHPLLCMYGVAELPTDVNVQVGFVAPKKHYKTAVQRNQIKRWMREAYRQHSGDFEQALKTQNRSIAMLFITLKSDNISYELVRDKMVLLLRSIEQELGHDR
jgi:ribonuclease P protein component